MDVYMDLAGGTLRHPGLNLLDRVLTAIGSMLVTGATVRIVSEAYLGRTPRLGDALRFAGGRLGAIFGANLLGGLLTFLALIALVIPGVADDRGFDQRNGRAVSVVPQRPAAMLVELELQPA